MGRQDHASAARNHLNTSTENQVLEEDSISYPQICVSMRYGWSVRPLRALQVQASLDSKEHLAELKLRQSICANKALELNFYTVLLVFYGRFAKAYLQYPYNSTWTSPST